LNTEFQGDLTMIQSQHATSAERSTERSVAHSVARNLARIGFSAILISGLVACKSTVKLDEGAPVESRDAASMAADAANAAARAGAAGQGGLDGRGMDGRGGAGGSGGAGGAGGAAGATAGSRDPLADPNSPLAKRSVYFDYDSYAVRDEYRSTIDAHARFLTSERSRRVIVQGNTDERGSREYNLALGQKRAEAVRRSLTALGVPDSQVEAVSLGEEKPRTTAQDEASFAENRRADLVYP
jgi:peptidoglycan-associated lipoprotein